MRGLLLSLAMKSQTALPQHSSWLVWLLQIVYLVSTKSEETRITPWKETASLAKLNCTGVLNIQALILRSQPIALRPNDSLCGILVDCPHPLSVFASKVSTLPNTPLLNHVDLVNLRYGLNLHIDKREIF